MHGSIEFHFPDQNVELKKTFVTVIKLFIQEFLNLNGLIIFTGCLVAEIIKHFLPNNIELHNYTPASSLDQKKANWAILNLKVFSKLGINLPDSIIGNICNSRPGFIEVLLHNLRLKITDITSRRENLSNNVLNSTEMSRSRSRVSNATSLMISRLDYEEKVQECYEKAEQIEILQAKVRRLEHLVQLKDLKIEELTSSSKSNSPIKMPSLDQQWPRPVNLKKRHTVSVEIIRKMKQIK
jgi:hypothetical protein